MVPAAWESPQRAVAEPDPVAVEHETVAYFKRIGLAMPTAVESELRQLHASNEAVAAMTGEGDREILDVVARAQARQLVNHLLVNDADELVDHLRSLAASDREMVG
jgi:hypothetical protein